VTVLGQRFCDALCWANALHAEQRRKVSGVPYVSHVLAVASLVIENDGSEDEAIAALLHDAAEDCGGQQTLQKIREQFGSVVANIVLGCSDTLETPKPPWHQRKQNYLIRLAVADRAVKLVSLADKVHNLRTSVHGFTIYGDTFWKNFNGGREGLLWYYKELTHLFERSNLPAPLLLDLSANWRQLHELLKR
jgi:(p)ppGpp synthase/HD superfamily hydrolase